MLETKFVKGRIIIKGRPANFSAGTLRNLPVSGKRYARRHMLSWVDIRKGIETVLNYVLSKCGIAILEYYLDQRLIYYKMQEINFTPPEIVEEDDAEDRIVKKIKVIAIIAFSHKRNLVVGLQKHNLGIEVAGKSIKTIRKKLDEYCAIEENETNYKRKGRYEHENNDDVPLKTDKQIKEQTIRLINASLKSKSKGVASAHRIEILKALKAAIEESGNTVELIRILHDFEISCTLDIVHASKTCTGTTKDQNADALDKANRLKRAIYDKDYQTISEIVF